jgi:hypothetical protein
LVTRCDRLEREVEDSGREEGCVILTDCEGEGEGCNSSTPDSYCSFPDDSSSEDSSSSECAAECLVEKVPARDVVESS